MAQARKVGALYNEIPDRIADSLFLVALGYASGPHVGRLACRTGSRGHGLYPRAGWSLGLAQDFRGPQAKPHRMAVMTVACLAAIAEGIWFGQQRVLQVAVVLIAAGSILTCGTRTLAIARQLRAR